MSITIAERTVLGAILKGSYRGLTELRRQIDHLSAYDRKREYHHYSVHFRPSENLQSKLSGTIRDCRIAGTVIVIEESESKIVAGLDVFGGIITYLSLGGAFDFRQDFTISSYYWENSRIVDTSEECRMKSTRMPDWVNPRIVDSGEDRKVVHDRVHDPKLRDWKNAIGYYAMYR